MVTSLATLPCIVKKSMSIISKILAVQYNDYFDWLRLDKADNIPNNHLVELGDVNLIKSTIVELLFTKRYDYLLVAYDGKVYHVEKDSDSSYCKKEITYHPLLEKVS